MSELLPILMEIKGQLGEVTEQCRATNEALPALINRVTAVEKQHSKMKGYGAGFVAAFTALEAYLKFHK